MLQKKISDFADGNQLMLEEMQIFFNMFIAGAERIEKNFPALKVTVSSNDHLQGGYNFEINKHTLVSQFGLPIMLSAEHSFISLAIYDLVFNKDGFSVNKHGMPETFIIDNHLLKYMRYELYHNEDNVPVWTESDFKQSEWTSEELAGVWIGDLLKRVQ